jgi:short-subunit dehydrogenase
METIIITGAGSGLGKELALLFSQQGYHIILIGRTYEKLASVKNELPGDAEVVTLDIRKADQVQHTLKEINKTHRIVGLINNAGVGFFGGVTDLNDRDIADMLDTNVLGTILMTKAAIPILLKNGNGRLINIISTAGLRGKVNESVYVSSKFAVRGFTESLQKEFENTDLKITAVYMGGMDTPFWEGSDHVKDTSRFRSPKEVAELILKQIDQDSIIIESKKS